MVFYLLTKYKLQALEPMPIDPHHPDQLMITGDLVMDDLAELAMNNCTRIIDDLSLAITMMREDPQLNYIYTIRVDRVDSDIVRRLTT